MNKILKVFLSICVCLILLFGIHGLYDKVLENSEIDQNTSNESLEEDVSSHQDSDKNVPAEEGEGEYGLPTPEL